MIAELLALIAAFLWAISGVLSKKGLKTSDFITGAFITNAIIVGICWFLCVLLSLFNHFVLEGFFYHLGAGMLGVFIGNQLSFMSFSKVGVAKSSAIIASESLFSSFAAVIFLGEKMTLQIAIGTILIILGVVFLSALENKSESKLSRKHLIYPIFTAIIWGLSSIFTKKGVDLINSPILSVTIEFTIALLIYIPYLGLSSKKLSLDRNSFAYFSINGAITSIALVSIFYAFRLGNVITVLPLFSMSPFFSLFFVHIFLRELERINIKIVVSTIFIVLGTALMF